MRKLHVMQITHDLQIGGLQQVVVNLCRTMDRAIFDVSVLCMRSLGPFAEDIEKLGIKVVLLPQKKSGADYLAFLKVARVLRQEKVDVIHTHNTQPLIDGTIAALIAGVKIVIHTDHARVFPDKLRYMFTEWLMSHFVYKVVGVSDHTAQSLIKYERISPKKIMTITNGIDGTRYNIQVDKPKKRKDLGITNDGPVIGAAGRLTAQKGLSDLLSAMPEIIKNFPAITLVIAGEGDHERILKQEAVSLGIEGHILFVGPRLDIPEFIKTLDLYVLPSHWEGLPMVLLEAMAAGCPIIATNVGGISSAIMHGKNGSLIEPGNPSILAKEIIRLLKSQNIRSTYVRNGLEEFKTKFSAEIMTRQYQKLYLREI